MFFYYLYNFSAPKKEKRKRKKVNVRSDETARDVRRRYDSSVQRHRRRSAQTVGSAAAAQDG